MYEYCQLIGLSEEAHTERNELLAEDFYNLQTVLHEILYSPNISFSSISFGLTLAGEYLEKLKKEVFSNNE